MIKLLRGQSQTVDIKERINLGEDKKGLEVSVSFAVNVVDSALQTRLQDLAQYAYTQEGKQRYVACQLKNCVTDDEIIINGTKIGSSELASMADYNDATTVNILALISMEIDKCVFVQDDEVKK